VLLAAMATTPGISLASLFWRRIWSIWAWLCMGRLPFCFMAVARSSPRLRRAASRRTRCSAEVAISWWAERP